MALEMIVAFQEWPYREVFTFARETRQSAQLYVVHLTDGTYVGRGECGIQSLKNETPEIVGAELQKIAAQIDDIGSRAQLNRLIPARSWRNAVDCAFWDLECKRSRQSIWQLTGVGKIPKFEVDLTIGINALEKMCLGARDAVSRGYRLLKIKADANNVISTVHAISQAVPRVSLIVDANEAWSMDQLRSVAPQLSKMNVVLIEQPLHHERDSELEKFDSPIPICADESCATSENVELLATRYDALNIKLDKTGGLTEALILAREAKQRGLGLMMGCNGATSLGNAPAYVVGSLCDWRDVDSQEMLFEDRAGGMMTRKGDLYAFDEAFWG